MCSAALIGTPEMQHLMEADSALAQKLVMNLLSYTPAKNRKVDPTGSHNGTSSKKQPQVVVLVKLKSSNQGKMIL